MTQSFKKLLVGFFVVVFGALFATVFSYAASWTAPVGPPPDNNVEAPVNVGSATQVKVGDFRINNSDNDATFDADGISTGVLDAEIVSAESISTGTFFATGLAEFLNGLDARGNRIVGVATPVQGMDAVNKGYLDQVFAQTTSGAQADNITLYGTGSLGGPGGNAPACPASYPTQVLAGYGPHWVGLYQVMGNAMLEAGGYLGGTDVNTDLSQTVVASYASDSICSSSAFTIIDVNTTGNAPSLNPYTPRRANACGIDSAGQLLCNSCRICSSIVP